MADNVHRTAKDGFKQGSYYDQHRPSYTDELTSHVARNLYKGGNWEDVKYNVLEIGAGTGKFTRKILQYIEDSSYLATDQSEDFLSVLKKQSPDIETKVCSASSIPLSDHSVQNIICAQCFHWFANAESLKEMMLLLWNNRLCADGWTREMDDILTMYHDVDTPRYNTREWQAVVDSFTPLKSIEHSYLAGIDMRGDKDFVLKNYGSISVIIKLEDDEKKLALQRFRAVLDANFKDNEEIQVQFNSEFYCAEKI